MYDTCDVEMSVVLRCVLDAYYHMLFICEVREGVNLT